MSLTCDHCGEAVRRFGIGYIHTSGYFACDMNFGPFYRYATYTPRPATVAAPTTPPRPWRVIPDNELPALG